MKTPESSTLNEQYLQLVDEEIQREIVYEGKNSVEVDWEQMPLEIRESLEANPEKCLENLQLALFDRLRVLAPDDYEALVEKNLKVRIRNAIKAYNMADLNTDLLHKFICVNCIIIRSTNTLPMIKEAVFDCLLCDGKQRVIQEQLELAFPSFCVGWRTIRRGVEAPCRGKWQINLDESVFEDTQILTLQENPEDSRENTMPIKIDVRLPPHLIDLARAGDRINVYGLMEPLQEQLKSRIFAFTFKINNLELLGEEIRNPSITGEEKRQITKLGKDPELKQKLIASISPSIYGYQKIKYGLALLLFGGVSKTLPDGMKVRGDIHMMMIGDPGTAKSVLLQHICNLTPRGIYSSGGGASGVGLTAAVVRDKDKFVLEAGTVVLANGGIACIDELDKMGKEDRGKMHVAMAQQIVVVDKGGIRAILPAKCSVLAAANPKDGRFDPYKSVGENITFPATLLTRFDLIWLIKDVPDEVHDLQMTDHILKTQAGVEEARPPISPDLLKKYVATAKKLNPIVGEEARKKIREFYFGLRNQSGGSNAPMSITPRQLESLIRLTEASARMYLRKVATQEDALNAIELLQESLIQVGFDAVTGAIDIDKVEGRIPKSVRERRDALLSLIEDLSVVGGLGANIDEIYVDAEKQLFMDKREVNRLLETLSQELYQPRLNHYKRVKRR